MSRVVTLPQVALLLPFLSALSACAADKALDDDTTVDGGIASVSFDDIQVQLSPDMPTVATVTWTTDQPTSSSVSFGGLDDATLLRTTATSEDGLEHSALLVGLPEGSDAELWLHAHTPDGDFTSAPVSFSTGVLSAAIPRPTLTLGEPEDSAGGYTLLPVATDVARWATVVDPAGRLVWAFGGAGLETQRVRLTHDGQGVVIMDRAQDPIGMSLFRIDWDGTERWRVTIADAHHDFDLVDDETFVLLVSIMHDVESSSGPRTLLSDAVVELKLDGTERVLWDAWDHLDANVDAGMNNSVEYPDAFDWSHANNIRYDQATDSVLLTLRELDAAASVDRTTGNTNWILGRTDGDFDDDTPQGLLRFPHSIWPVAGGVMVFNQRDSNAGECAEASLIALDLDSAQASLEWSYRPPECFGVYYLGNAQPLSGDRALVSFSNVGVLDEVDTTTGEAVWRLTVPSGAHLLYIERFGTIGTNTP